MSTVTDYDNHGKNFSTIYPMTVIPYMWESLVQCLENSLSTVYQNYYLDFLASGAETSLGSY